MPAGHPPRRAIDWRVLLGILPVVAFYVGYQWNAYAAIGLGLLATGAAYYGSDRKGLVGVLALIGLVVATVAALVGIVLEDERAFLARDASVDFLLVLVALGSVLCRRPIVGWVARDLWPQLKPLLPLEHRVFMQATLLLALANLIQGVVRVWMLFGGFSVGEYLVYSRVFGWPVTAAMLFAVTALVRRAAREAREEQKSTLGEQ